MGLEEVRARHILWEEQDTYAVPVFSPSSLSSAPDVRERLPYLPTPSTTDSIINLTL